MVPLKNVALTLTLTIASLALTGFLWREQGYEMLIVAMGWPHVILGFLFFFGKVVRREAKAREAFVMLACVTLAIWIVHYNYAITGLIYLYFLYHAFRDEIVVFLQTRARHRPGPGIYAIAGVAPAILFMLLVPQQQNFRHDLRRVDFGETAVHAAGTLIAFKPVPNSRGRDFYFYLQAPHTAGRRAFTTPATTADVKSDGKVLVNDRAYPQAGDLVFLPHYSGEPLPSAEVSATAESIPVLLTGGHRVGQTFRADRDNLDGVWLPISRLENSSDSARFTFHLASPPLLPYPRFLADMRFVLLIILGLLVIWKLWQQRGHNHQLWVCLIVLVVGMVVLFNVLKSANNAGYSFPLIFQFVVVFHYWSWYVFSFDKLRALQHAPRRLNPPNRYDAMLARLRSPANFATFLILLNLISVMGVFWYYKLNGPAPLRLAFDYNYFLYFLVFHVTFSFAPLAGKAWSLRKRLA